MIIPIKISCEPANYRITLKIATQIAEISRYTLQVERCL